jgi:hypothetical protein
MKVLLVMPLAAYNLLLTDCKPGQHEYPLLKNGLVDGNGQGFQEVTILCDGAGAETILELAAKAFPDTLSSIRRITPTT